MTELLRQAPGWSPPPEFEEYRLVRLLGRGVMGEVHLAHDLLLDRPVAVKFVAGLEPTAHARERFFVEARAIARVQHPNVVAIHRVGQVRGRPYLVSEYIRGESLEKLSLPLPWERASEVGLGLARGLAAAHRMQVLHRDLKPANAILSEAGEAKLVDFGLAVLLDAEEPERPAPPLLAARAPALEDTLPLEAHALPSVRAQSMVPARGPVGTPLYMAPELWRGEPASCQSDVYALGALLYELCTGAAPFRDVALADLARTVQERAAAPVAERAPAVPAPLAALIDACLERDPTLRPRSGEQVREALEALHRPRGAVGLPEGNPYRGLQVYDVEHRGLFFGREREVRALLERLRSEPLVLVAGDSGVGKSSLCRAGVLPAVAEGALGTGLSWSVARIVPGKRPVAALAAALAPLLEVGEEQLAGQLLRGPGSVARALRKRTQQGTLLFVDQLEELWTLAAPAEAAPVLQLLATLAVRAPQVRVLATLRSDFLTRLAAESGLGEELTSALYLLRPLAPDSLREAIVGPARARGVQFESPELVDTLTAAAARSAGSLPLMQFALSELWEARDEARRLIPGSALERLGGVSAALARHADGVIASLPGRERAAAERILTALVSAEGTRARRTEGELAPDGPSRAALQALLRGRLLVACEDAEGAGLELAHDALLGGWDTLRGWLGRDAEKRALRQRLERAAAEWERLGRGEEGLWTARQLQELRRAGSLALAPREQHFTEASTRLVRRRRRARSALALALPALLVLGLVGLRVRAQRDRDRAVEAQVQQAEGALASTHSHAPELERRRQEAFAHFDRGNWDAGEAAWGEARRLAAARDAAYWRAGSALEAALQLAPTHEQLRARFADLTVLRIEAAEQGHRPGERAELLERLAAYDPEGNRRAHLERPAELRVHSEPAGARVRLLRYDASGRAQGPPQLLGTTPLASRPLPPGAYLLELEGAAGPVRLPLRARAGEQLALSVPLPARGKLPPGFLYVPAGRFGFGFGGDEDVRRGFFGAAPLHEVATGAYLIGRHEVTFADWLSYLRALPARERARRLPRARTYRNSLELRQRADGRFELLLQPTTQRYTALEGEPLRYGERDRRAAQDWLRLPVSAISFEDAQAYATWLSRTGRVPGARLCDEREWERAARGADARPFPGGDTLDPDDANFDLTYGRRPLGFGPDEVGSHPRSRSPVGADDMAGNVWEFTHAAHAPGKPVLRGGSWYQGQLTARSANREPYEPTARDTLIGFRLCASPQGAVPDSP